jgi:hypothetical protein
MWIIASDIGVGGIIALSFIIGFLAGWWTAIGSIGLIVKGILWGMSDRRPISHDRPDR